MTFKVYFRPEAERDIEDASSWYEDKKTGLGTDFLDEVLTSCQSIAGNPNIYPGVYKSIHRAVINRFPFGVFYKIEKHSIVIVAVMHGSRHPKKWQTRF